MSNDSKKLNDAAELALAGYSQFDYENRDPRVVDLMIQDGKPFGFAESQATAFAQRFKVAKRTFNDIDTSMGGSGRTSFDATVFVGTSASVTEGNINQVYIALRGTQSISGAAPNDVKDREGDLIWINGATIDQIIAMYNWWMREATPAGQVVAQ